MQMKNTILCLEEYTVDLFSLLWYNKQKKVILWLILFIVTKTK